MKLGSKVAPEAKIAVRGSCSEEQFEEWYWSYGYASKALCIKVIEQSDLPEEEKKIRVDYHKGNLGKFSRDIF